MKRTILLSTALILGTASMSLAGGWGGKDAARADAHATASSWSSANQAQGQSQNQAQGQIANVTNAPVYNEAVQAPSIAAGNCDAALSLGTNGTLSGNAIPLSVGGCWQTRTGNAVRVGALLIQAGATDDAIMILNNTAVAKRARRAAGN